MADITRIPPNSSNQSRSIPMTKREPAHSSAKRIRGACHLYSQLLPIALEPSPSGFLSKLLPQLRPNRPKNLLVACGRYDTISNSVWVIKSANELWQKGFFGKGSLSRSEPTWLQRAKNRRLVEVLGNDQGLSLTAEELTAKRRIERKETKIQKSKLKQLLSNGTNSAIDTLELEKTKTTMVKPRLNIPKELELELELIKDMEHLQLMNEEAFFLCFGLGCLDVSLDHSSEDPSRSLTILELWDLFCRASLGKSQDQTIRVDNPFILSYVVYHHFRSLGWVIRSGIKFCADWVLYGTKGPVGGHAEFAVCMMPIYDDGTPVTMTEDRTSWRWLSTVNRVCAGVKKTLILVQVIVPRQTEIGDLDSPAVLTSYIVKEIALRRFIPARMRD
ncbi:hypothetical protein O181_063661 [Austropuccinia psidii MF-1]|uniref:tRNA-intron lyase n=1 Tax=Austropuccinia psidii MF-1 TaxID=1389203 RepID=A0A9Q3HZL1_9BASI|nr:hypothetical protein [Austropuccinia psidii MF-1]